MGLSPDELARLSALARAGDIKARNAIVEANRGGAAQVAMAAARRQPWVVRAAGSVEDVCQTGLIALIRAAEDWDPSRGIKFQTYAAIVVERAVRDIDRYRRASRSAPAPIDIDANRIEDTRRDGRDSVDARDAVDKALSRLDPFDREAIVLRYGIGGDGPCTFAELGARRGVTRQAAEKALAKIERRLAELMAG